MAFTLIYDDGCRLCRAMADFVARRDWRRRIALAPLSSSDAILRRAQLDPAAVRAEVHLLGDDGSVRRGISVVQPVLAQLAFWRRIGPLLKVWPLASVVLGGWLLLQQLRHRH